MLLSMLDSRRSDAGPVSLCLTLSLRLCLSRPPCLRPPAVSLSVLLTFGVGIISALRRSVRRCACPILSVALCASCVPPHGSPGSHPPFVSVERATRSDCVLPSHPPSNPLYRSFVRGAICDETRAGQIEDSGGQLARLGGKYHVVRCRRWSATVVRGNRAVAGLEAPAREAGSGCTWPLGQWPTATARASCGGQRGDL
jgi:hypothetical protein